jgi:hypothetical protein
MFESRSQRPSSGKSISAQSEAPTIVISRDVNKEQLRVEAEAERLMITYLIENKIVQPEAQSFLRASSAGALSVASQNGPNIVRVASRNGRTQTIDSDILPPVVLSTFLCDFGSIF